MPLLELEQNVPTQVFELPVAPGIQDSAIHGRTISAPMLVLTDVILIWLAAGLTLVLYSAFSPLSEGRLLAVLTVGVSVLALIVVMSSRAQGLYGGARNLGRGTEAIAILISVSCGAGVVSGLLHLWAHGAAFRFPLYVAEFTAAGLLIARGHLTRRYSIVSGSLRGCSQRVLVMGDKSTAEKLEPYLKANGDSERVVVTARGPDRRSPRAVSSSAPSASGNGLPLRETLRSQFVDQLLITLPADRDSIQEAIRAARDLNIRVGLVPDLCGVMPASIPLEYLGPWPVFHIEQEKQPRTALFIKRCFDVVCAALLLAATMPVLAIAFAAIRIDSPGPVIYVADRVGRKGRRFRCYKLRTMIQDAEAVKESLRDLNHRDAILFKVKNDPRITRVGRFLRRYSIDELPQLWNVLKGDMSLIGPRPSLPEEVAQYQIEHLRRFEVTPGLTGLWQISGRRDPSFSTYIRFDDEYVANWSLWLDCKIFFKTIFVVLAGTGE